MYRAKIAAIIAAAKKLTELIEEGAVSTITVRVDNQAALLSLLNPKKTH